MSAENEWKRIDFLQRESHDLAAASRAIQSQMMAALLGIPTVGAGVAVGLTEYRKFEILLIIPTVLPLAWLAVARLLTELFASAAQRWAVENEMASALSAVATDAGFRPWEAVAGKKIVDSLSNIALWSWFGLLSLVLGIVCIVTASANHVSAFLLWMTIATFSIAGTLSIVSGLGALRLFNNYPRTFDQS